MPATSSIAIASLAASVVSTGAQMYGQVQQGKQATAQARYQQQVAENNATIAENNAKAIAASGRAEEQRQRIANAQKQGEARANMGGSGLELGSGTLLDLQADQVLVGEYDALTVRDEYVTRSNNALQQAANFSSDATLFGRSAKNASSNAAWGTAGTLLSGAGKVAGKWYDYKQAGAWD